MQILIVGIGALGGTIAARAIRAGLPVRLAARNTDSAEALRRSGLRVSGIGGEVRQTLSTLPQLRTTERETSLT